MEPSVESGVEPGSVDAQLLAGRSRTDIKKCGNCKYISIEKLPWWHPARLLGFGTHRALCKVEQTLRLMEIGGYLPVHPADPCCERFVDKEEP